MEKGTKQIELHLVGGLGNQLFILAAGIYLAEKFGRKLRLTHIRLNSESYHNSGLADFELDYIYREKLISSKRAEFKNRLLRALFTRLTTHKKFLICLTRRYISAVVGYDTHLMKLKNIKLLVGYFQTYRYIELTSNPLSIDKLQLKHQSPWLEEKMSLMGAERPIAVHVRLGDYMSLHNRESIGVLSLTYYKNCIDVARNHFPDSPVWIYSNDISEAEIKLSGLNDGSFYFLNTKDSASDSETLFLMAHCMVHIISNSTFSWWAAYLNREADLVIAPNKWFKGMADPTDLIPPTWRTVSSEWV
jgi:hypothetical protein